MYIYIYLYTGWFANRDHADFRLNFESVRILTFKTFEYASNSPYFSTVFWSTQSVHGERVFVSNENLFFSYSNNRLSYMKYCNVLKSKFNVIVFRDNLLLSNIRKTNIVINGFCATGPKFNWTFFNISNVINCP